jgi:Ca2+-binding EF-hand superfamily protein
MAKLNISNAEFQMLCTSFKAPKAGEHVNWRDFCDSVDEVFTKKGLEKDIDKPLDNARTQTLYGRAAATRDETSQVQSILDGFTEVIRKNRLDAKSFFQDWDRHKHFKVSQKQFRQVLVLLGYQLSVEQVQCVATKYGEANGEIRYAEFLRDANCLEYIINGPTTELKSTYVKKWTDFNGAKQHDELMRKIMN